MQAHRGVVGFRQAAQREAHLRQRLVGDPRSADHRQLVSHHRLGVGPPGDDEADVLLAGLVDGGADVLPLLALELEVLEVDDAVLGDLDGLPAKGRRRGRGSCPPRQARDPPVPEAVLVELLQCAGAAIRRADRIAEAQRDRADDAETDRRLTVRGKPDRVALPGQHPLDRRRRILRQQLTQPRAASARAAATALVDQPDAGDDDRDDPHRPDPGHGPVGRPGLRLDVAARLEHQPAEELADHVCRRRLRHELLLERRETDDRVHEQAARHDEEPPNDPAQ